MGMGLVLERRGTYIYVVSGVCGSTYYYYETRDLSWQVPTFFRSSTMPCGERGVVDVVSPLPLFPQHYQCYQGKWGGVVKKKTHVFHKFDLGELIHTLVFCWMLIPFGFKELVYGLVRSSPMS